MSRMGRHCRQARRKYKKSRREKKRKEITKEDPTFEHSSENNKIEEFDVVANKGEQEINTVTQDNISSDQSQERQEHVQQGQVKKRKSKRKKEKRFQYEDDRLYTSMNRYFRLKQKCRLLQNYPFLEN